MSLDDYPKQNVRQFEGVTLKAHFNPVWCPFCLCHADKRKFQRYLVSGSLARTAVCPECGRKMLHGSLITNEITIQSYARWVAAYSEIGFWHMVNYERWYARLRNMGVGIASLFWDEYHLAKKEKEVKKADV